ncbi:MAG TPA: transposase [Rhodocyclaceae bacterium]|nr:transposase [Rhodocyclaceae bacterium]
MQLSLFDLPWWAYALFALGTTHVTIVAVTIFLHRHQAHHALDLHPAVGHFFRFWLWLNTGMVTREWVAIHRKHHAKCESLDDPHSPQVHGLRAVLLEGSELYRMESSKAETLSMYGHGVPDDWIERRLYSRHPTAGVGILMIVDLVCFGAIGLTVWAVQMLWIPFFAAGVINGMGHYWGYRSFATRDASRNIVPWGILIGGEELHNNHHAYSRSARLSNPERWWEIDVGWLYICLLVRLHLARVRSVVPRLSLGCVKPHCDGLTLEAIIAHRFDVLARFARSLHRTAIAEASLTAPGSQRNKLRMAVKHWLQKESIELPEAERMLLDQARHSSTALQTIYVMRQRLIDLWSRSTATQEQLVRQLEDWCLSAEESGIAALQGFSRKLRCYG